MPFGFARTPRCLSAAGGDGPSLQHRLQRHWFNLEVEFAGLSIGGKGCSNMILTSCGIRSVACAAHWTRIVAALLGGMTWSELQDQDYLSAALLTRNELDEYSASSARIAPGGQRQPPGQRRLSGQQSAISDALPVLTLWCWCRVQKLEHLRTQVADLRVEPCWLCKE